MLAGRSPRFAVGNALQAGGRRFDPGWLHSSILSNHAGLGVAASVLMLATEAGWKRYGSLPLDLHLHVSGKTVPQGDGDVRRYMSARVPRSLLGRWCDWLDVRSQKRRRGASRSPVLAAAEVNPVEGMTSPSYPSKRGTSGHRLRPWATSQSARAAGAGWASALRQSRA